MEPMENQRFGLVVIGGLFALAGALACMRIDQAWIPVTGAIAGVVVMASDWFRRPPRSQGRETLRLMDHQRMDRAEDD